MPITRCGSDEVKQFQTQLTDYQINVVSKKHQKSIIFSGPEKENVYIYFCTITITMLSLACRHFLLVTSIVISARKGMINLLIIYALILRYIILLLMRMKKNPALFQITHIVH